MCFWLAAVLNFVIKYFSSIVQNRFAIDSPGGWLKLLSPLSHPIRSWSSWRDLCACVSPLLVGYTNWISGDKCRACEKGLEILKQLSEKSVAKALASVFRASQNICQYLCVCWLQQNSLFFLTKSLVEAYNKFVFVEKNPRDVKANGWNGSTSSCSAGRCVYRFTLYFETVLCYGRYVNRTQLIFFLNSSYLLWGLFKIDHSGLKADDSRLQNSTASVIGRWSTDLNLMHCFSLKRFRE